MAASFTCVLATVVIAARHIIGASSPCVFPKELENAAADKNDFWQSLNHGGAGRYRFVNDTLTITRSVGDRDVGVMNAVCLEEQPGNVFLMHPDRSDPGMKLYFCLHFDIITLNIVHCSTGMPSVHTRLCIKTDHEMLDQPLIANQLRGDHTGTECPLRSGYTFHASLLTADREMPLCPRHPAPGILEIECQKGEGTTFHFPSRECFPIESVDSWTPFAHGDQLYCLGSWTSHNYSFTLLADSSLSRQWCMAYTMTPASRFTILIYEGAVCPLPHSHLDPDDVILKVRVQRLHDHAQCLDDMSCDATRCHLQTYRHACQRTCDVCGSDMRTCEFDDDVVPPATWWHDGHDALTTATTETQLVEANGSVLSCERRMNAQTYMMRRLSRGTCPSRKLCLKFTKLSGSILLYQTTQLSPLTTDDVIEACSDKWFSDHATHTLYRQDGHDDYAVDHRLTYSAIAGIIIGGFLGTASCLLCVFGACMLSRQARLAARQCRDDETTPGATAYRYTAEYDKLQDVSQNGSTRT